MMMLMILQQQTTNVIIAWQSPSPTLPSPLTISILEGVFSTHCMHYNLIGDRCMLGYFGGSPTSHNPLYYNTFIYCALQAMLLPWIIDSVVDCCRGAEMMRSAGVIVSKDQWLEPPSFCWLLARPGPAQWTIMIAETPQPRQLGTAAPGIMGACSGTQQPCLPCLTLFSCSWWLRFPHQVFRWLL